MTKYVEIQLTKEQLKTLNIIVKDNIRLQIDTLEEYSDIQVLKEVLDILESLVQPKEYK